METWLQRRRRCGQRLIHMKNNDIFTTGTSWFFCRKCPLLSPSTHVSGCPFFGVRFGYPVRTLTQGVEIESCQLDVSVIFQHFHAEGKRFTSVRSFCVTQPPWIIHLKDLFIIIYTLESCVSLHSETQSTMTMETYTLCNEYYTDRSSQKTVCCFWLKSNSRENTSQTLVKTIQQRIQTNKTKKKKHIIQALLIQYDFYSSNSRQH